MSTRPARASPPRVVGTVAEQDLERVGGLGAAPVLHGEGWVERVKAAVPVGVDCPFTATGAYALAGSVALIGDPVKVITIVDPTAAQREVGFTGRGPADRFPQALPQPAGLIAAGRLDLPVWQTYPLVEAAQATPTSASAPRVHEQLGIST
ncbi:hypothetical protein [Streptomyces sp. NPDC003710]